MKPRLSNERGQAMVEFVIVLPLMFALVLLIAYAGIAFVRYLNVTDAAQAGARAATVARFSAEDPCAAATQAASDAMNGFTISVSCSSPPGPAWQTGDQISVTVDYSLSGVDFLWLHVGSKTVTSTAKGRIE
jgi:Flp pilus assembly protein TadG